MARKPPQQFDLDQIRAAAAHRWPEILSAVCGWPSEILNGKHHPCPKCQGTDRFRFFDSDEKGGCICNRCGRQNGDGFASIQWGKDCKFPEALRAVADHLGIAPTHVTNGKAHPKKTDADPAEHLTFGEWTPADELIVTLGLCRAKPGITVAALKSFNAVPARYRDQYSVVAIPIYGPHLTEAKPVGWCIMNVSGGTLPAAKGEWVSKKLTYGSKQGFIGQVGKIGRPLYVIDAENPNGENQMPPVIWKCEGPTDALALAGIISETEVGRNPTQFNSSHFVVTNANGANEKPLPWMVELFTNHTVRVLHDADKPGQDGAARWTSSIAATAAECRNLALPFPVEETHGRDARDWINDGATFADFLTLASNSPIVARPTAAAAAAALVAEDDKDPHRLARRYLESTGGLVDGILAVRYWREEFWRWNGRCYRSVPHSEMSASVNAACKAEFDRLARERSAVDDDKPPLMVTRTTVSNVLAALEATCILPASVEPNSWLGGESPASPASPASSSTRLWVSMENGLLHLDDLLADADDVLHPHSPHWFSPIALPYSYDPEAECPKFEAFLAKNLEGDEERIAVLQEWSGYCLTPCTDQQKFIFMEGEGANGKSVYLAALQSMVGRGNCSHVKLDKFEKQFDLYDTYGKLVNISADTSEIEKAAEGEIKSFVSGDTMRFDRKHKTAVSAQPTAKLVVAANNRPRFSDRSQGIWRRMIVIPWNVEIDVESRVRGMDKPEWWESSGELPGVFLWAVVGLARLYEHGQFTASLACNLAAKEYQDEMNPTRVFIVESFAESPADGAHVVSKEAYELYKAWCREHGHHPLADRTFGKEVKRCFKKSERRQARVEFGKEYRIYGIVKQ